MKLPDGIVAECEGRHGRFLYFQQDIYIGRSIATYGEWSEIELQLLLRLLKPGATVIEIGANIGTHTVPLARHVGPTGRLIAFEPQPMVFDVLCSNIERNGLANVDAKRQAVGKKEVGKTGGTISVPTPQFNKPGNFGGIALGGGDDGVTVPLVPLDDLDCEGPVHLLKMDMEGMEHDGLSGGTSLIDRYRPIIWLENDRREQSPALIELIHLLGYRAFWYPTPLFNSDNWRGVSDNLFGRVVSLNMLCIPAERDIDFSNAIEHSDEFPF